MEWEIEKIHSVLEESHQQLPFGFRERIRGNVRPETIFFFLNAVVERKSSLNSWLRLCFFVKLILRLIIFFYWYIMYTCILHTCNNLNTYYLIVFMILLRFINSLCFGIVFYLIQVVLISAIRLVNHWELLNLLD